MKRLKSVENDQVQLEVIECDCGYHMGIDATYLDQVGDFMTRCPNPACRKLIETKIVCPEYDESHISEIMACIDELKPWINGDSGTYQGIYADTCRRLCKVFGWDYCET